MALKPGQTFQVMQVASRHGVLDEFLPILGEALDGAMDETNLNLDDLFNKMDGAGQETVDKVDRALLGSGLLLRMAGSDRLMKLFSRLLDRQWVRRMSVLVLRRFLVRSLRPGNQESAAACGGLKIHAASMNEKSLASSEESL